MKYKLGEIFSLQMGKTPDRHSPEFWSEGTEPWISIADLTKCIKYIENTAEKITATAVDESGIKIIPKNTVIMSFKLSIGKVAITPKEMYSNEAIMSFIDKGVLKIEPVYLYYLLMHKDWDTDTNKAVMGKTLNKATLSQMTVNIHGYSEQLEIIKALDTASSIITARKQQLAELDNLIKARFVEMFGTIHDNRFGFSVVTLQDVSAPIKDGTHQTPTYTTDVENGYKFLSSKDVTAGKVDWSHLKYIPEELHRELYARISPRKGDILLAKNGTTGIAAIVDRDEVFDIYVSLALIRPLGVDPTYLWAAINAAETKQQFDASLKGIGVPNLHLGEIKKARIILPPMELQEQFAAFVEQTDKSKAAVQKALDEAQMLFDSLMQKYFG